MYERGVCFFLNGLNPKAVNSFGAMVPSMGPIFAIHYAMRRRKKHLTKSHIYRTEHQAPRAPKLRGPWRPKRRRGRIETASRATHFDTQPKLRLLLNASSVY